MSYSNEHVSELLKKTLDIHGHGFHFAVLSRMNAMSEQGQIPWRLHGTEFPVINKGETTHADFILDDAMKSYLIGECKRADPARANWCFVKAPFTWSDNRENYVQFDKISQFKSEGKLVNVFKSALAATQRNITHLGIEVNTGEKGDGIAAPHKSAINQAVSQVLRSSSGFVNHFWKQLSDIQKPRIDYRFIPTIFTTAQLWVTDTNLGEAELSTGILPKNVVKAEKVDWLWFNHNRSPNLAPDLKLESPDKQVSSEFNEFVRSVAIVSPSGIDAFFKVNMTTWLQNADY